MTPTRGITTRWLSCVGVLGLVLGTMVPAFAASPTAARDSKVDVAEQSRDAGLLTDWHLIGRFGRGAADFAQKFAPEHQAAEEAAKEAAGKGARSKTAAAVNELPGRAFPAQQFETVFPTGKFALPNAMAGQKGVFYAVSYVFLSDGGEWNVYLESPGEADVFVDGRRVLTRSSQQTGAQRETIHAAGGYHLVMVKFLAQSAPFRVAILPPNSGSKIKNNTPHFGGSENLNAMLRWPAFGTAQLR